MKNSNYRSIFLTLGFAVITIFSFAQKTPKTVTTTFWVGGVCDMCEARIEKAMDVKGVKYANYSLDTHMLEVSYKPKVISEDELHKILNNVGHDTEKSNASNEQYDKVHGCCKYRDHGHEHKDEDDHNEDHEDHDH